MKPGIYNMPAPQYHADPCPVPSMNAGLIGPLLDESPAHAFVAHPRLDGSKRFVPSEASDNGSVAHGLLFEGVSNMVEVKAEDWRTKDARLARDAARAEGKTPALTKQVDAVKGMAAAASRIWTRNEDLKNYPQADGVGEQSIFWTETDPDGFVHWFRIRPDWISNDRRMVIDGKFTMTSANPTSFERHMRRMDFHSRAAFYLRGIKAVFGTKARYVFLAVEQQPPFEGLPCEFSKLHLEEGEARAEEAIALWKQCMRSKVWPGYGNRIHVVDLPAWAMNDEVVFEDETPELEKQA